MRKKRANWEIADCSTGLKARDAALDLVGNSKVDYKWQSLLAIKNTEGHMTELHKNAIAFLQKRFPVALVLNNEYTFSDGNGNVVLKIWPMIAQDMQSGIKQRAIVVENLGSKGEIPAIAQSMEKIFKELDGAVYVKN